jgi:hypothetical protein
MTEPRNVTPGFDSSSDANKWGIDGDHSSTGEAPPEWFGMSWTNRGRGFPWLGVLLVLVGAGLLIQYFVPAVSLGTLILLAISLAFLAGWIFGGSYGAMIPGLLILALAVARLVDELHVYSGPGTTSLCVAAAFLLIWLIAYTRGRRSTWPLWGVAIFGLIGGAQVAGRIAAIPELGALWPLAIIILGILLLLNGRRGQQPPPPTRR